MSYISPAVCIYSPGVKSYFNLRRGCLDQQKQEPASVSTLVSLCSADAQSVNTVVVLQRPQLAGGQVGYTEKYLFYLLKMLS